MSWGCVVVSGSFESRGSSLKTSYHLHLLAAVELQRCGRALATWCVTRENWKDAHAKDFIVTVLVGLTNLGSGILTTHLDFKMPHRQLYSFYI